MQTKKMYVYEKLKKNSYEIIKCLQCPKKITHINSLTLILQGKWTM